MDGISPLPASAVVDGFGREGTVSVSWSLLKELFIV
jgi:hypothetical protein